MEKECKGPPILIKSVEMFMLIQTYSAEQNMFLPIFQTVTETQGFAGKLYIESLTMI